MLTATLEARKQHSNIEQLNENEMSNERIDSVTALQSYLTVCYTFNVIIMTSCDSHTGMAMVSLQIREYPERDKKNEINKFA